LADVLALVLVLVLALAPAPEFRRAVKLLPRLIIPAEVLGRLAGSEYCTRAPPALESV